MDVVTLIAKVRELIAASKAGNYMLVFLLFMEIAKVFTGAFPTVGAIAQMQSPFTDQNTIEAKLEECCVQYGSVSGPPAMTAAANRPFIDALLPLLSSLALSLLKKWLGI